MSVLLDELSKRARKLDLDERVQLAQDLLASVDQESDPAVQAAWDTEIASRITQYERGEAKLIPAAEIFEAARRLTQCSRFVSLKRRKQSFSNRSPSTKTGSRALANGSGWLFSAG